MRDDITSIPISEIFETKDGCPICRLRNMLEERSVTYITGAAMMEPDVRIETNKAGFCNLHYTKMIEHGPKLSVALILQSHLGHIASNGINKQSNKKEPLEQSCFICKKMNHNMAQILSNLCILWEKEKDFRKLYSEQPYICLPHCRALCNYSEKISKRNRNEFIKSTTDLTTKKLDLLTEDITEFCNMFDYRNAGKNSEKTKDSIERTVEWLTTRKI